MKQLLITLLLLLLYPLSALDFNCTGIKIGYNSSHFTGDDIYGKGVSDIPGFLIGGFVSYDFNQHFTLDSELLLSTKGSCVNTIGDIDQHNVIVYLEIPAICKYRIINKTPLTPTFSVGTSFAIRTIALNDTGILDNICDYDICLLAVTGFEFHNLTLEFRLHHGMINIDHNSLHNSTLSLITGIKLWRLK